MIKFVDVTKLYDNNTLALKNINLTIENGATILMATHAKDIVDSMKKRVIAIENGTIIRDEIRGTYDYEN